MLLSLSLYNVSQLCLTLCDSMDCNLPGSSVHGVVQARKLEWLPFPTPEDLPDPCRLSLLHWILYQLRHLGSPLMCLSLLKFMSIEPVMPSSHLILCGPLLLLPPNPSQHQGLFQWVNSSMRWPKYWSFSFSITPSKEHRGLTSFRMDWLDLLAVQETLKSLFQHHSSKASIFRLSAFFTVQLSHPNMTTGKTIALTRQTFVGKVMSLLFKCCLGWS